MLTKIKTVLISFGYRETEPNIFMKPVGFLGYVAKIDGETLILKSIFKNKDDNDLMVWGSRSFNIPDMISDMGMEGTQRYFANMESAIFTNITGYGTFNWITPAELLMLQM